MSKKILIVSVSAGAGHVRAASALAEHVKVFYPEWEVHTADFVEFVSRPTRKVFFDSYETMATELPRLWSFFYNSIDVPKRRKQFDRFTSLIKKLEAKKFIDYINDISPDVVLGTHFIPADIIGRNKKHINKFPHMATVITDYAVHELWLGPDTDHYFVGTEKMAWQLKYRGIESKNITVSGIPVSPVFTEVKPKNVKRKSQDVGNTTKVVLVLSGGQGMAGIDHVVETLFLNKTPIKIIAVAGKNQELKTDLLNLVPPPHINLEVIGWTDKIENYMTLADVIVTKPGGLTVSEAVVMQKPIIAIRPIPGQEEQNVEYILEHGYGVVAHSPEDLLFYISEKPENLAPGHKNKKAEKPGGIRPNAGQTILEVINQKFF